MYLVLFTILISILYVLLYRIISVSFHFYFFLLVCHVYLGSYILEHFFIACKIICTSVFHDFFCFPIKHSKTYIMRHRQVICS